MTEQTTTVTRRRLLAAATTATAAGAAAYWWVKRYHVPDLTGPWGALLPQADEATGLPLLRMPDGFRYTSFGWSGDVMADGAATPSHHDGMAVVRTDGNIVTLVRNHEIDAGPVIGPGTGADPWDDARGGGTTTIRFDLDTQSWLDSRTSLSGTSRNCAGGPTPWGTWLSCEEILENSAGSRAAATHGWVFEVDPTGARPPQQLPALGRFVHEAAAVDPRSGIVYLTEDRRGAGFYRLLPTRRGDLAAGGRLQMLAIDGRPNADLRGAVAAGVNFPVAWVDIDEPQRAHWQGRDGAGVVTQGFKRGAASFQRLEGCWYEQGLIHFTSTSGGAAGAGQIWEYQPATERLRLVYESPSTSALDSPDNIVAHGGFARGNDFLMICEDGGQSAARLIALTPNGRVHPFAQNNIVLGGERGIRGNFRRVEWTGASFSGDWLFVNAQKPGITFAITGPWDRLSGQA